VVEGLFDGDYYDTPFLLYIGCISIENLACRSGLEIPVFENA
jgi:hypothetical protein